ncbi:MAG: glycerate kinase [Candidatus Paceibacterota bacterium]
MISQNRHIKNFEELSTTPNRAIVLEILEAGLAAIDTELILKNSFILDGDTLSVQGKDFDLTKFKKIKVVGFGKASAKAAVALDNILGDRISEGVMVGLVKSDCEHIETFAGTHPRPSSQNLVAGTRIREIVSSCTEDELVIAVVSGGGSALLCDSEFECDSILNLYDAFLGKGGQISEMNTVRKHLSDLKGGGLAKLAYPATLIGLIFSDVPGTNFADVASGPTYFDPTTVADAEKIVQEKNLGSYELKETNKDPKYFENVHNFVLVENKTAVSAMQKHALDKGIKAYILSTEFYDEAVTVVREMDDALAEHPLVLAAGEPRVRITKKGGSGGRNMYLCQSALYTGIINEGVVFASLASDGMDNSDMAGAIVDSETKKKIKDRNLDEAIFYENYDSYNFFSKIGDLINTGPTGANVSDIMLMYKNK